MKIAVVTAIYGSFDTPKPIPPQSVEYDYFLYTEKTPGFVFREELSDRLKAKFFKYQQHNVRELQEYDIFIWVDGNFIITSENFVEYMVRQLQGYDLAITTHNHRDCIYQEFDFIINSTDPYLLERYGKEKALMMQQALDYKEAGMPAHWGLFNCGLFARRKNYKTNLVMDYAWMDCIRYGSQDQHSLPFYLWEYDLPVNRLAIDVCFNNFWKLQHHG